MPVAPVEPVAPVGPVGPVAPGAAVPVPESGTVSGEPEPLYLISSVADLEPMAAGLNLTCTWQVPPDGICWPVQFSLLMRKSSLLVPEVTTLITLSL
jgi:hypothetical protein